MSVLGGGLALLVSSCGPGSLSGPAAATGPPPRTWPGVVATIKLGEDRVRVAETVFVPIYSSIATANNGRALNLACTLTVRNADPAHAVVVDSIRFYDSAGKLVRSMLATPVRVNPLAAIDLFVGESDTTGGPTPSFLVDWSADTAAGPVVVEAVMISTTGGQGIAFTSTGRVVDHRD